MSTWWEVTSDVLLVAYDMKRSDFRKDPKAKAESKTTDFGIAILELGSLEDLWEDPLDLIMSCVVTHHAVVEENTNRYNR